MPAPTPPSFTIQPYAAQRLLEVNRNSRKNILDKMFVNATLGRIWIKEMDIRPYTYKFYLSYIRCNSFLL